MGNVILTGFMGCGKSSVAIKLSYRLKKAVVDTDKWIEKKQGKRVAEIFEQDGEDVFRDLETQALKSIKQSSRNDIISVGGGTPMREENRSLMKEMGTVVYLRLKPETALARVRMDGSRPLLNCEDPLAKITELLEKRGPLYEECAHVIVDVDDKHFGQILFEIEKAVRDRENALRAEKYGQRPYGEKRFDGERRPYGERKFDGERKYDGEKRSYGERRFGGYNGFKRFGDNGVNTAANAEQENASISQHAQNIQFALQEDAQRQERWLKRMDQEQTETAETADENVQIAAEEVTAETAQQEAETVTAETAAAEEAAGKETAAEEVAVEAAEGVTEETAEGAEQEVTAAAATEQEASTEEAKKAQETEEECTQPSVCECEKKVTRLLVINGPNLNFLGIREKAVYGTQTYQDLLNLIAKKGIESGIAIEVYQSNHEGAIIDKLQAAYFDGTDGIVINPGAYSHYSYAIRDALACLNVPKVEVHISNIMEREPFRQISVTAPVCDKQIYGQGLDGYLQAIDFIAHFKKNS